MKTYTTKKGDTWSKIAYEQYGSEYLMTVLLDYNQRYRDIAVFSHGVTLQIPDIEGLVDETPFWMKEVPEEVEDTEAAVDDHVEGMEDVMEGGAYG
ncbi:MULTISPECIES: tail protein X [Geobacillus]|uniref:Tail protein X n=1 Tax=Geobacillus jurassicus TaxID=235932 RepID=A0ABV6GRH7_9BACL|nr:MULTISPECIES: tail protein X [Geobacillus]WPZ18919.1 tail protein X [Geobacillus subterraneus]